VSYWLREAQGGPVRLTITDAKGDTVRTIQGPGYAGLQRAQWDGMRDRARPRALGEPTTPAELRMAEPGAYVVTMTVSGVTMRQPVVLREWPADRRGRLR
jgi:flagellar hook assembly protein FlgD